MLLSGCAVLSDFCKLSTKQLDSVAEPVLATLLKLSNNTKKMISTTISGTLHIFMEQCTFQSKFLGMFLSALSDKSANVRQAACISLCVVIQQLKASQEIQNLLLRGDGIQTMESIIKKAIKDSDPTTRTFARNLYYYYNETWPDRGLQLFNLLEPATQKAINKMGKPTTGAMSQIPVLSKPKSMKADVSDISPPPEVNEVKTTTMEMIIGEIQSHQIIWFANLVELLKIDQLAVSEYKSKLRGAVNDLYNNMDSSRIDQLANADNIQLLENSNLVATEDILVPLLKIYMSNNEDFIQKEIDIYLGKVRANFTTDQLLKLLVNLITSVTSKIPAFKVSSQVKEQESLTRRFMVTWIKSILESQAELDGELLVEFFSDDAVVRLFASKVIPMMVQFSDLRQEGAEILGQVFAYAPESFKAALSTFDEETSRLIIEACGLPIEDKDEATNLIDMQQEDSMLCDTSAMNAFDESMVNSSFTNTDRNRNSVNSSSANLSKSDMMLLESPAKTPIKENRRESKQGLGMQMANKESTPKQIRYSSQEQKVSQLLQALSAEDNLHQTFDQLYKLSREASDSASTEFSEYNCDLLVDILLEKLSKSSPVLY